MQVQGQGLGQGQRQGLENMAGTEGPVGVCWIGLQYDRDDKTVFSNDYSKLDHPLLLSGVLSQMGHGLVLYRHFCETGFHFLLAVLGTAVGLGRYREGVVEMGIMVLEGKCLETSQV